MPRYPEFFIQAKNKPQDSIYHAKCHRNLLKSHERLPICTNKCPRESVGFLKVKRRTQGNIQDPKTDFCF